MTDDHSGSRIELTGGTPILIKILWVLILLGASGLIAAWAVFSYPYNLSHDPAHSGNYLLAGIVLLSLLGRNSRPLADRRLAADPVSLGRYRQRTAEAPGFEADQLAETYREASGGRGLLGLVVTLSPILPASRGQRTSRARCRSAPLARRRSPLRP